MVHVTTSLEEVDADVLASAIGSIVKLRLEHPKDLHTEKSDLVESCEHIYIGELYWVGVDRITESLDGMRVTRTRITLDIAHSTVEVTPPLELIEFSQVGWPHDALLVTAVEDLRRDTLRS